MQFQSLLSFDFSSNHCVESLHLYYIQCHQISKDFVSSVPPLLFICDCTFTLHFVCLQIISVSSRLSSASNSSSTHNAWLALLSFFMSGLFPISLEFWPKPEPNWMHLTAQGRSDSWHCKRHWIHNSWSPEAHCSGVTWGRAGNFSQPIILVVNVKLGKPEMHCRFLWSAVGIQDFTLILSEDAPKYLLPFLPSQHCLLAGACNPNSGKQQNSKCSCWAQWTGMTFYYTIQQQKNKVHVMSLSETSLTWSTEKTATWLNNHFQIYALWFVCDHTICFVCDHTNFWSD